MKYPLPVAQLPQFWGSGCLDCKFMRSASIFAQVDIYVRLIGDSTTAPARGSPPRAEPFGHDLRLFGSNAPLLHRGAVWRAQNVRRFGAQGDRRFVGA